MGREKRSALVQFETLGNQKHFHNGKARRATIADLHAAQVYWSQVFSGWFDWALRMRAAMDAFSPSQGPRGCDGIVANYVHQLSVTACAAVYGDLNALGAMPHISNANRTPHQDAILELDFMLRLELEAAIATLYVSGGHVV